MKKYQVIYSVGKNNELVYPPSVADVIWTSVVYDPEKQQMIGETDSEIQHDGKNVIELKSEEAENLINELRKQQMEKREHSENFPPRKRDKAL